MQRTLRFKLWIFRHHIWVFSVIAIGLFIVTLLQAVLGFDWKVLLTAVGGSVSLIYIVEKQRLDETILFKQLFTEFNKKYDELNGPLNEIKISRQRKLTQDQKNNLYDYFNLCAEEYLFYKNGYIYPDVWKGWINGMAIFYAEPKIANEWEKELETGSYYGFNVRKEIESIKDSEPVQPKR